MSLLKHRLSSYIARGKPKIYEKMEYPEGTIATQVAYTAKEKLYDYYICDYCGQEIKITDKWENSKGGICEIPSSITGTQRINLALHNSCLNKAIKELRKK